MDLVLVLQRLYDSEINVTVTMLWDGGFDFALASYMDWEEIGRPIDYMKTMASVEPRGSALIDQIRGAMSSGPINLGKRSMMPQLGDIRTLSTQNCTGCRADENVTSKLSK
jgi:hypothetical protein